MTDRLIRGAVALWFLMLASIVASGIGTTLLSDLPFNGLDYARFASKACLLSFLAMMAGLILTGNVLCVYVLSYLGRSFSIMAEARKLVSDGPYGIVRHPLYLAEQIAILGIFIQFASMYAAILIAVHFIFQLRRMLNEENLLRATFPEYAVYMTRTARLIPAIW